MLYLYYVIYVTAQPGRLRKIIIADDNRPGRAMTEEEIFQLENI